MKTKTLESVWDAFILDQEKTWARIVRVHARKAQRARIEAYSALDKAEAQVTKAEAQTAEYATEMKDVKRIQVSRQIIAEAPGWFRVG